MRHVRSGLIFGTIYNNASALAHKQALIKNYCFYDQTTQNYSTANNPNKHYFHFTPFHVQNHNKRAYANS